VVLGSTILGSCANESLALCNNYTLFAGFSVAALQLSSFRDYYKKIVIFVMFFVWL